MVIIYLFFNRIKMAKLGGGGKGKRGRGTSHNIYLRTVRNRIDRGNNNGMVSVTDWICLFICLFFVFLVEKDVIQTVWNQKWNVSVYTVKYFWGNSVNQDDLHQTSQMHQTRVATSQLLGATSDWMVPCA